jgi:hypothetical protein
VLAPDFCKALSADSTVTASGRATGISWESLQNPSDFAHWCLIRQQKPRRLKPTLDAEALRVVHRIRSDQGETALVAFSLLVFLW